MNYSVGQVAAFAGVTVKTLHHYDRAGLLSPSGRSHAGYRLYGDADLARLQQILFYRELGFSLDEIAAILEDPQANALEQLRARQSELSEEIARLQRLADVAERAIEVQQTGVSLTPQERFDVFGEITFDLSYATEARLKWADSAGQREAMARADAHTKEDWRQLMAEAAAWRGDLLAAFDAGEPGDGEGHGPRRGTPPVRHTVVHRLPARHAPAHRGRPRRRPACVRPRRTALAATTGPRPLSVQGGSRERLPPYPPGPGGGPMRIMIAAAG